MNNFKEALKRVIEILSKAVFNPEQLDFTLSFAQIMTGNDSSLIHN